MGIEYLNSAAAAAGFAMVSEESTDETDLRHAPSRYVVANGFAVRDASDSMLPVVIEPSRTAAPSLGARVTGLLDAWRSKG